MSKRKRYKPTLAQTQKKRQWEFFVLRDRRDAVMNLLRLAEMSENHDTAVRLQNELEAIELRGADILQEQMHFLRTRSRAKY